MIWSSWRNSYGYSKLPVRPSMWGAFPQQQHKYLSDVDVNMSWYLDCSSFGAPVCALLARSRRLGGLMAGSKEFFPVYRKISSCLRDFQDRILILFFWKSNYEASKIVYDPRSKGRYIFVHHFEYVSPPFGTKIQNDLSRRIFEIL